MLSFFISFHRGTTFSDLYDQEGNLLDSGDGPSEHELNRPLTEEDDEGEVERGMGVVPDDNEPAPTPVVASQYQQPQQIQSYQTSNPIPTFSSEAGGYGGGYGGGSGVPRQGGGGSGQGMEERARPSDMPEEGLVHLCFVSSSFSVEIPFLVDQVRKIASVADVMRLRT